MTIQDGIAFLIVAIAAGFTLRHGYRKYAVKPLSAFLLKRGKVGLAMRIRNGKPKKTAQKIDPYSSCH